MVDAPAEAELRRLTRGVGVSASSQPSAPALAALVAQHAPRLVLVVDLRKESHGFLNGSAVSWYAQYNWGAVGLTSAEAEQLEALRLRLLAGAAEVDVGTKESVRAGGAPDRWTVQAVQSEREVVEALGGQYLRLPTDDHCGPGPEVVARWRAALRGLPSDVHVHVHCRGGRGRTASFLALREGFLTGASFEEAAARVQALTGYDLTALPDPAEAKYAAAVARLATLRGLLPAAGVTSL
ncbi:MAG: hypothetical protein R3F43_12215 [bacterium]